MRTVLLPLLLITSNLLFAQTSVTFELEGLLTDTNDQPLEDVVVTVKQGRRKVSTVNTDIEGFYSFNVELTSLDSIMIIYSKKKYNPKIIQFNIAGAPNGKLEMPPLDLELIPKEKGKKLKFLKKEPIAIFTYNADYRTFVLDRKHTQLMKERVEGVLKD